MNRVALAVVTALILPAVSSSAVAESDDATELLDQAYAYNREGMMAMSKARFEEAIEQFQQAAALVPDYGITRRGLLYTPNFMTGWAYEKMGQDDAACRYFRRFLDFAPSRSLEAGKADHASAFLARHCPAMQPHTRLPEEQAL
jgi:tetratricopeptide (TPR) repeat protein